MRGKECRRIGANKHLHRDRGRGAVGKNHFAQAHAVIVAVIVGVVGRWHDVAYAILIRPYIGLGLDAELRTEMERMRVAMQWPLNRAGSNIEHGGEVGLHAGVSRYSQAKVVGAVGRIAQIMAMHTQNHHIGLAAWQAGRQVER